MDCMGQRPQTREFLVRHQLSDLDSKGSSSPTQLSWWSMRKKAIALQARTDVVVIVVLRSYLRVAGW